MADIVSASSKVNTDETGANNPITKAFATKIGANINYLIDQAALAAAKKSANILLHAQTITGLNGILDVNSPNGNTIRAAILIRSTGALYILVGSTAYGNVMSLLDSNTIRLGSFGDPFNGQLVMFYDA